MAYNNLLPVNFIVAGDMSADITSAAMPIEYQDNVGIQLNWTGTPAGTFDFQISIDHTQNPLSGVVINEGNWISLVLNPAIVAAGSPDNAYVDLNQMSAAYIRVVYADGGMGGTGVLDAFLSAKGV